MIAGWMIALTLAMLTSATCAASIVDLHTHSVHSDGTNTQRQLIQQAHRDNISIIAFTDHDQLVYDSDALSLARSLGITVIQGVEVSAEWPITNITTIKCHLLGYFTQSGPSQLNAMLEMLRDRRHHRNLAILDKLAAQSVFIEPYQLLAAKSNSTTSTTTTSMGTSADIVRLDYIGRPHIARAMINKGYVSSMIEAFNNYLDDARLSLPEWSLSLTEAVTAIDRHGGLAVLAHPKTLRLSNQALRDQLYQLVKVQKIPLVGLEAYSSRHSASEAVDFIAIADELGLLVTGGSDYHGANKVNVSIGVMGGGHSQWLAEAHLRLSLLQSLHNDRTAYASVAHVAQHLLGYVLFGLIVVAITQLVRSTTVYAGLLGRCQSLLKHNVLVRLLFVPSASAVPSSSSSGSGNGSEQWLLSRYLRYGSTAHFLFCFVGLQCSYLVWGYLQERLMTQTYQNDRRFVYSEFLVLVNRVSAAVVAIVALALTQPLSLTALVSVCPPADYSLCSLTNILSSWFQYESLHYVSFPFQVLSKSSKILLTMVMGSVVNRQRYSGSEYGQALAIMAGLVLFQTSEHSHAHTVSGNDSGSGFGAVVLQWFGYALLLGYMLADSFTSTWQSHLYKRYQSLNELTLMLGVNTCSMTVTLAVLVMDGSLIDALTFVANDRLCLYHCLAMSLSSATGQLFIFHTIAVFGPVSFASIMTLRQLLSLVLSMIAFNHTVTVTGVTGLVLVFAALTVKIQNDLEKTKSKSKKEKENGSVDEGGGASDVSGSNGSASVHLLVSNGSGGKTANTNSDNDPER